MSAEFVPELLTDLFDVDMSGLSDGDAVVWDAGSGKFVAGSAGSGVTTGHGSPQGTNAGKLVQGDDGLTGGTYTLTYLGQTTDPIAYDAGKLVVRDALRTLTSFPDPPSSFRVDGGSVAAGSDNPLQITFINGLGSQPISDGDFTGDFSLLEGGAADITDAPVGVLPLAGENGQTYVDVDAGTVYAMVAGNWWQTYPVLAPFGVDEIFDGVPFAITGSPGAGAGGVTISGGEGIYDDTHGFASLAGADNSETNGSQAIVSGGTSGVAGAGAPASIDFGGGKADGSPSPLTLSEYVDVSALPTSDPGTPGRVWVNDGVLSMSG